MNILFLMKPLETIIPEKDTSLLFMQACERSGHNIFYLPQGKCSLTPKGAMFDVTKLTTTTKKPLHILENIRLHETEVDTIFVRTDPPFDSAYLHDMWILEQTRINIVNDPKGIRTVNEKIWVTQFKELIPKTIITSQISELNAALAQYKTIILKPTDGFGGQAICKVTESDVNKNVLFEMLTKNNTTYVIAQEYIQAATIGDKRILLLDGNPIGSLLRVHSDKDHRNNFFAGGQAQKSTLTKKELYIVDQLKPHLNHLGLRFVGIDIIGDFLIEVNVTSPTCLQELNALENATFEDKIVNTLLNPIKN